MPIDTVCPGCQAKLRMADEFAGQQARCPRCDAIYLVVAAPPPEEVRAAEPAAAEPNAASAPPDVPDAIEPSAPTPQVAPVTEAKAAAPSSARADAALPEPDGSQWFLKTPEGPIYGPATEPVFQRWVTEGRVTKDCAVCPGDNRWHTATKLFPELAAPRPIPRAIVRTDTIEKLTQPHRGLLILILGIMGIVTTCPIPGIMAWVMGSRDLVEMQRGRMDPAGQNLTYAGRMLGLFFTLLYVLLLVIGLFTIVYLAAGM